MNEPTVPHRFEHVLEVHATPEQVWAAIATARGTSAWMVPTEMEEHEGGAVAFELGPDAVSRGRITAYEPNRRLVYEEDWAPLAGGDAATVSPMATEFLVEARSGGACVVRIVTSAFGSGADWEHEFWAGMEGGWRSMLDNLGIYLEHFAGREATLLAAQADLAGEAGAVMGAMRAALGVDGHDAGPGDRVAVLDLAGRIERIEDGRIVVLVDAPVEALLSFDAWSGDGGVVRAMVSGYLYRGEVAGFVEREQPRWTGWLASLGAPAPQEGGA